MESSSLLEDDDEMKKVVQINVEAHQKLSCLHYAIICLYTPYGPGHVKMCLMPYANNKGADQPAHPCSLISTFVVCCLDSMILILAIFKISRF